jgi:hypothetical protein
MPQERPPRHGESHGPTGPDPVTGTTPGGTAAGVLSGTYPNPGFAATVDGAGLLNTAGVLSVVTDGSTLEINVDTLRAKDGGITLAKLAADAYTNSTWTPALTASVTNPTLGTSPIQTGTYLQVGKWVIALALIRFGTGSPTAGSGTYSISLPVTANVTTGNRRVGTFTLWDNSATAEAIGSVFVATGTTVQMIYPATWPSGTQTNVSDAAPWVWAASDELWLVIQYLAA